MVLSDRSRQRSNVSHVADPSRVGIASVDQGTEGIRLGGVEQWMLERVRRYGAGAFVATVTFVVALVSVALTLLAFGVFFGYSESEVLVPGMLLAAGIPAVVAPITLYGTVRLTARLDTAGQLLRLASLTDPLTNVLNRRGFFEATEALEDREHDVLVAMVDIDDFKQLNDRHGHAVGDQVLVAVADWLEGLVDEGGVVSRMGGDEFALILPISAEPDLPSRRSLTVDSVDFSITLGASSMTDGRTIEAALARADRALYNVKSRCAVSSPAASR
ncbi:MAG: GGDEF domain-containing protein [Ilumatobacter sp.]